MTTFAIRKSYVLVLTMLVVSLLITHCSAPAVTESTGAETGTEESTAADGDRAKTVIFTIDGGRVTNPLVWNPYAIGGRRDGGFQQALMEPLFFLNYATGEIEPWLGESMTPNDTLDVWTLKLREGAYWSDGEPITADDVVFSINLLISHSPDLLDSSAMETWVAEVAKLDDYTVEFTLNQPNPRFQLDYFSAKIVSGVNIVPEHIWEGQDPLTFTNYDSEQGWPIFSGAYKLESATDTELTYVRDDNWWGAQTGFKPLPKPEKLVWLAVANEESQMSLISQNELDSLNNVSVGAFTAISERNPNIIAWNDPPIYATYDPCPLELVVNHAVEPWNDQDMRWVLNYVIDRDQVAAIAYEGTGVPSKHFFPYFPALMRYVELLEDQGVYDQYPIGQTKLDAATQLLESKGYNKGGDGYWAKDGAPLTLEFAVPEYVDNMRIAQIVVEQLQTFGINATSINVASSKWWTDIAVGEFTGAIYISGCGSVSEPWASLNKYNVSNLAGLGERAGSNVMRWSGPQAEAYGELVDEIGTLPLGDPQIDELYVQAMEIWMDEAVAIPIAQNMKIIAMNTTYWTNWPTVNNDYVQPWTWWQSTHELLTHLEPATE